MVVLFGVFIWKEVIGAKGGNRTPTAGKGHKVLSLARLPIPPLSREAEDREVPPPRQTAMLEDASAACRRARARPRRSRCAPGPSPASPGSGCRRPGGRDPARSSGG